MKSFAPQIDSHKAHRSPLHFPQYSLHLTSCTAVAALLAMMLELWFLLCFTKKLWDAYIPLVGLLHPIIWLCRHAVKQQQGCMFVSRL